MKKISNFIQSTKCMKKNGNIFSKTETGSRINTQISQVKSRLTDKINNCDFSFEQDIENELRLQIEQLTTSENLQKLLNNEKYLSKATDFYKSLTPDVLDNYNLITFFEYQRPVYYLKIVLYILKDGTKIYLQELNGKALNKEKLDPNDHNHKLCRKKAQLFMAITQMFACLTYYSKIFRSLFSDNKQNVILDVISDKSVLLDCINIINKENDSKKDISDFIKNSIEFLNNLSKTIEIDTKKIGRICLAIIKMSKVVDEFMIPSFMFLACHSNLENCSHKKLFTERLIEEIQQITGSLDFCARTFPIYFDSSRKSLVSIISKRNLYLNLIQLLDTIFYLTSDLKNEEFFQKHDLTCFIKTIILSENHYQAEYAVRILFQLTFNKNFKITDPTLITILKKIIIYQYPNSTLLRYCEGVLWMCEKNEKLENIQSIVLKQNLRTKVFVSHDPNSYEQCSRLEEEMKQNKFMVWLKDVKKYSLEDNLLAILSSDVVLIVLCNDVCYNLNCRVEYEFAIESRKKILPLILQEKFVPKSWVVDLMKNHEVLDLSCLSDQVFNFNFINSINRLALFDSNDSYKSCHS